jgi:hypothetical protein
MAFTRAWTLVTYGNRSQLEYDLAVAPGADPGEVQWGWEGPNRSG